jgi:hypothetical protein
MLEKFLWKIYRNFTLLDALYSLLKICSLGENRLEMPYKRAPMPTENINGAFRFQIRMSRNGPGIAWGSSELIRTSCPHVL